MAARPIWARVRQSWKERFNGPKLRGLGDFSFRMFTYATWIPVVCFFKATVLELTAVNGASMYPFFNPNKDRSLLSDIVVNCKWDAQYQLRRGMIVIFWNPSKPESTVIKRIVGLEGDVIRTRSPYPHPKVQVPTGHIWVEGDNEANETRDSNTYGPISTELIVGKVTHIVWPLERAGKIRWWEYTGRPKS